MADADNTGQGNTERHETTDPRNPPNSVANRDVRRTALRAYLGPLIALFIVLGAALIYWANRNPVIGDNPAEVGTTGNDVVGERGNVTDTPGGFDPQGHQSSTRDELQRRGGATPSTSTNVSSDENRGSDEPITSLSAIAARGATSMAGRRIDVRDATVTKVQDARMFSIRDDDATAVVMAPEGSVAVKSGAKVRVSGVVEGDAQGGVRIRASRVDD